MLVSWPQVDKGANSLEMVVVASAFQMEHCVK
jgi:hypothetical protein